MHTHNGPAEIVYNYCKRTQSSRDHSTARNRHQHLWRVSPSQLQKVTGKWEDFLTVVALTLRRTDKSYCLNVYFVGGTSCQEALYCTTQAQTVYRWSVGVDRQHDEFRRTPKERYLGLTMVVTWKRSPHLKRPLRDLIHNERANSTDDEKSCRTRASWSYSSFQQLPRPWSTQPQAVSATRQLAGRRKKNKD